MRIVKTFSLCVCVAHMLLFFLPPSFSDFSHYDSRLLNGPDVRWHNSSLFHHVFFVGFFCSIAKEKAILNNNHTVIYGRKGFHRWSFRFVGSLCFCVKTASDRHRFPISW